MLSPFYIIINWMSLHFAPVLEVEYVDTCILYSHKFKSSRVYLYSLKLSQKANRFKNKKLQRATEDKSLSLNGWSGIRTAMLRNKLAVHYTPENYMVANSSSWAILRSNSRFCKVRAWTDAKLSRWYGVHTGIIISNSRAVLGSAVMIEICDINFHNKASWISL